MIDLEKDYKNYIIYHGFPAKVKQIFLILANFNAQNKCLLSIELLLVHTFA